MTGLGFVAPGAPRGPRLVPLELGCLSRDGVQAWGGVGASAGSPGSSQLVGGRGLTVQAGDALAVLVTVCISPRGHGNGFFSS